MYFAGNSIGVDGILIADNKLNLYGQNLQIGDKCIYFSKYNIKFCAGFVTLAVNSVISWPPLRAIRHTERHAVHTCMNREMMVVFSDAYMLPHPRLAENSFCIWMCFGGRFSHTKCNAMSFILIIRKKYKNESICHYIPTYNKQWITVYPKKYAQGFCFAVLCCGYTLTDFPISITLTSLALWQSNDCPSASKATLMNMDKYFMWIHYERLHNHNKAERAQQNCVHVSWDILYYRWCYSLCVLFITGSSVVFKQLLSTDSDQLI